MARIKLAYIGGGSTRAPGTVASFIHQGENFAGSEIVLIDLNRQRLDLVKQLADRLVRSSDLDLRITVTTDRRAGLQDCDAVLTSFRPGGFEARHLDESIPLKYGVIGQETQGPGGFFMALRSVHVMQGIVADMEAACPGARLFNYTNPINIVSEAVTHFTDIPVVSLCEGPIVYPRMLAEAAGLDPDQMHAVMIGVNHACWSVQHDYQGQDPIPLFRRALERRKARGDSGEDMRLLSLAATMASIPSYYFNYYYFEQDVLAELRKKGTTRSQDIMARVSGYWDHYAEQAERDQPLLDPSRSRGGIHELELAFDVMDGIYNDRREVWPVNVPNRGAIPDFPEDLVVEVPGYVDRTGIVPLAQNPMPRHLVGLVRHLAEYQALAARAAWTGTRRDAIWALASNPLVRDLQRAEAIYDEMAAAHRAYLPDRLLAA